MAAWHGGNISENEIACGESEIWPQAWRRRGKMKNNGMAASSMASRRKSINGGNINNIHGVSAAAMALAHGITWRCARSRWRRRASCK